jgi:hypothetical protein
MSEPPGILQASRVRVKAELTTPAAARFSRPRLKSGLPFPGLSATMGLREECVCNPDNRTVQGADFAEANKDTKR